MQNYQGIINSYKILEIPLVLYHDPIKWLGDNIADEYTSVSMPVNNWIESFGTLEYLTRGTLRKVGDVATMFE